MAADPRAPAVATPPEGSSSEGAPASDAASAGSSRHSIGLSCCPQGRLRMGHVFGVQVIVIAACFAFTLAYLFVSLTDEIGNNTRRIISGVMQQYEDALSPPLLSATYVAARLRDELPLRNLLMSQLPNNTIEGHLMTYAAYRQSMRELPYCQYVYEDLCTGVADAAHPGLVYWDEAVCSATNCYRVTNNSAVLIAVPPNDGWVPSNFSQASLSHPQTLLLSPNIEGYYLSAIRAVPFKDTSGRWGVPYVWLEDNVDHIFPLQSFIMCVAWNTTVVGAAEECIQSITIDTNMQRLSVDLQATISEGAASITALVHMNTLRLISHTLPELSVINMSGLANIEDLYGTSLLTPRMWNAFSTPSALLTQAMQLFFTKCVTSRVLDQRIGETDIYHYEYNQRTLIDTIDDHIVGMRIIELTSDTQYLFLDFTPRSYFYASADRALRNTIIVAVVVSVVVVGLVALLFFSVSSAMQSLLDNIMVAESLDYEGVTETSMILYETQRVHDAFLALNARLLQTRAFLPQSIFERGLVSLHLPPSSSGRESCDDVAAAESAPSVAIVMPTQQCPNPLHPGDGAADRSTSHEAEVVNASAHQLETVEEEEEEEANGHRTKPSKISMYPRPKRLNLSSSLASRRVTVACGNIVGTHATFAVNGATETQRLLGVVLGAIERAVEVERGVIDLYHGDRVMVSFNASTVLTSSGPRAARSVLRAKKEMEDTPAIPTVRWGISTGNAVVGNFGTARTRRFCVCGPVVNQAFALMLHCRAEGVLNLAAPLTYDLIKDDFTVEHRNLVALTVGGSNTAPTIISTIHGERTASLMSSRWSDDSASPTSPRTMTTARTTSESIPSNSASPSSEFDHTNRAFEAMEKGDISEAVALVSRLPRNDGTKRLRQMLVQCGATVGDT